MLILHVMRWKVLLWLCLQASLCQAQEVSLRVAGSWVRLGAEEMQTEIKPGWTIAGQKLKDTRVVYLWGKLSRQMADDRKPVLRVEPGDQEPLVDYALIRLKRKRDHRRLPKDQLRDNEYVRLEPSRFSIQADGKQAFVCKPLYSLQPGEYVLAYLGQTLTQEQAGYLVYPFTIP